MTPAGRPLPSIRRERVPLFWLNYQIPKVDLPVIVIEAPSLIGACIRAALAGLDLDCEFTVGVELDDTSAWRIPVNMIGRFLDSGDLTVHLLRLKRPRNRGAAVSVPHSRDSQSPPSGLASSGLRKRRAVCCP